MTIKQLQKLCHKIAVEKGFWGDICPECEGTGKIKVFLDVNAGKITNTVFSYTPKFKKYYEVCSSCHGTRKIRIDRNNGELLALMHSELSEALEELRKPDCKMELVGEELAGCVIRILDFCGGKNIDLQKLLEKKIKKNKKRKYKHGKKF